MRKKILKGLVVFLVGYMIIRYIIPPPVLIEEIPFSKAIYDRTGHLLRLTLSSDDKYRLKVPLEDVSSQLVEAILLQEDQYFYWHFGVNPVSVIRAAWKTYIVGESRIGASTITMQVARLRWKIRSKTFFGKVKQIMRAVQLEIYYSKKEILEAYLNLLPYGHNIEGVGGASLIYFGKNPDQLTLKEALTLCVIPQRPLKRRPEGGKKQKKALLEA
ncbi:MAG TPA: penicillin-binding protein 1C, partial [Spirochaetes bacterium]|nr:penicillin-binding protein 1C [Spirochaetota bacterium]